TGIWPSWRAGTSCAPSAAPRGSPGGSGRAGRPRRPPSRSWIGPRPDRDRPAAANRRRPGRVTRCDRGLATSGPTRVPPRAGPSDHPGRGAQNTCQGGMRMTTRVFRGVAGTAFAAALALGPAAGAETVTGLKPAEPQPTAEQLAPGLAVEYTYAIMNYVD